jgi:hypothetical protein
MEQYFQINNDGIILDSDNNIISDIINDNPIHIDKHIYIDKQLYDIDNLYNYIKYKFNTDKEIATIPHNRKLFTEEILQNINNRLSLTHCPDKSEIITEIIKLLKFPQKTQKCLLALKSNERKIILEDYKINILLQLLEYDIDSIIDLVSEFYHLFDNNISDIVIKDTIKYNNMSLLLISSDKITNKIIKFAIQYHHRALQYIPDNKMTDEIINFAVRSNGYTLQYIPVIKMTDEIIKLAVKSKGRSLQFV